MQKKARKTWRRFKNIVYVSKEVIKLAWEASPRYTSYIIFILAVGSVIPLLDAYIFKKIIDSLTTALQTPAPFSAIINLLVLFFIIALISRFIDNQRNSTQVILGNLFGKLIHHKLADKITRLAYWRLEDPQFHDKLERVREQATWKPLNTFYSLFEALQSVFTLASIFVILYLLSPWLVLLMILFSLPSFFVQIKYGNAWYNLLFMETPESRKLSYYQHVLTNSRDMKDIKVYNLGSYFFGKYKRIYSALFNEQKRLIKRRYYGEFFTYLISDVVMAGFYIFITWKTYRKELSIGDFTFYTAVYTRGIISLQKLLRDISGVYENNLFINEFLEFLRIEDEESKASNKRVNAVKKGFEFRNVWFKHPGTDAWILKDISFKLQLKKSMALVGENGAGKTTIVKLLMQLYQPTKGQIVLDGMPIEKYNLNDYRNLFGIAFQDFANFYISVEENIAIGDKRRAFTNKEIRDVAKKVDLHKKIMSLPKGYKTTLGRWFHEGCEISYGEWQRVAIARALIKDAPIYILDEPTASLDAKAEYNVFKQFKNHVKGKMALFISHRFSNVRLADTILVIENGKIIQTGSHSELIKRKGAYQKLYNFQARAYKDKEL